MEAKPNAKQNHNRMIDIEYTKDETGDQNVDVSLHYFFLVFKFTYGPYHKVHYVYSRIYCCVYLCFNEQFLLF